MPAVYTYIRIYIYTGEYVEIWIPRMVRSKGPGQKGRRALFTERSNPLTADTVSTATDRVYTRSLWAYSIKCANSQDSFRPGGGGEVFSLFSPLIFKEDEDQTRPIFAKHRFNLISSTLFLLSSSSSSSFLETIVLISSVFSLRKLSALFDDWWALFFME